MVFKTTTIEVPARKRQGRDGTTLSQVLENVFDPHLVSDSAIFVDNWVVIYTAVDRKVEQQRRIELPFGGQTMHLQNAI